MPATYEPIATTTLGSAASSITFSSISSAYTDLRLVVVTPSLGGDDVGIRINSDSGSNYSSTYLGGQGSVASSGRETSVTFIRLNAPIGPSYGQVALSTVDLFSYAGSTNKTVLATGSGDNNGSGLVSRTVGLWRNTSAITSITIADVYLTAWQNANLPAGTTATLYGILKA